MRTFVNAMLANVACTPHLFLYGLSNWWYKALTMLDTMPIFQGGFDWAVLVTVVLYLTIWRRKQQKPTNKVFFSLLCACLSFLLIIDLLSQGGVDSLIVLVVVAPSLAKPAKEGAIKLLNSFYPQLRGCTKCMSFRNCWCRATSSQLPPATISNRLP